LAKKELLLIFTKPEIKNKTTFLTTFIITIAIPHIISVNDEAILDFETDIVSKSFNFVSIPGII